MIEPKTHTIEQPDASRKEVSSQPAADEELPSSGPASDGMRVLPSQWQTEVAVHFTGRVRYEGSKESEDDLEGDDLRSGRCRRDRPR